MKEGPKERGTKERKRGEWEREKGKKIHLVCNLASSQEQANTLQTIVKLSPAKIILFEAFKKIPHFSHTSSYSHIETESSNKILKLFSEQRSVFLAHCQF